MYTELFELCGFESEEIDKEGPRIDKAFKILEIGPEDVKRGEERIRKFFDIELLGVRKLLGVWMNELIEAVLAKEEKKRKVYSNFPGIPLALTAAQLACEDAYVGIPEMTIEIIMGQIFGKLNPILEAAEQHGMPPGLALCALSQIHLGQIVKGIVPAPDLILSAGYLCDQATKTDELLHETYGMRVQTIDGCMDSRYNEWPIDQRTMQYYAEEIEEGLVTFGEVTGCPVTDEVKHNALVATGTLFSEIRAIEDLMKTDPVPLSQIDGALWWWMEGFPIRNLQRSIEALKILHEEIKQRVKEGRGVMEKGAPKVLLNVPPACDPSIVRMVEESGLSVPATWQCQIPEIDRLPFQLNTFEGRVAEAFLRLLTPRSDRYVAISKAWNVDGVILLTLYSCRPFSSPVQVHKKYITEQLGIPVLVLEGDVYDSRIYSAQQLRTRVETFAEIVKAAKAAKAV